MHILNYQKQSTLVELKKNKSLTGSEVDKRFTHVTATVRASYSHSPGRAAEQVIRKAVEGWREIIHQLYC